MSRRIPIEQSDSHQHLQSGRDRQYLFVTVFVSGMSTLAVEFTASRMLQTVYGTSNIVWANVIGLVLLFLTLGYFWGGRLADRNPSPRLFYSIVTLAGFSSVFFLLLTSILLRDAASALAAMNVNALISSLAGVILALAVPVTLLGSVSPFAIRLAVRELKEAGRVSGRIYAVSTWGSLLGTYLPVLVTIPLAGSRLTALGFGTLLLLVGVGGLWRVRPRTGSVAGVTALLLLLPTAVIGTRGGIKDYEGQLFETESSYNYVQVIRRQDCNYLLLNEGQAYHSYYCDGGRVPRISVWSIMLAAPYFNQSVGNIDSMAVIGLAAGTIAKQFTQLYGPIPIDGIEIDSEIIRAGRDYFGLEEPNINVIVGDGRYELSRLDTAYNVITIDAYKVPYIPWHLTTREFFQEVRRHLNSEDGVVAINVGRVPDDRALVNALAATLTTVFPSVHGVDVPGSLNTILVATVQPTASDNLIANLARMPPDADPLLRSAVTTAAAHLVKIEPGDIIFTDQRAPVEIMTDAIVVRYLLREGPAGLPGLAQ